MNVIWMSPLLKILSINNKNESPGIPTYGAQHVCGF